MRHARDLGRARCHGCAQSPEGVGGWSLRWGRDEGRVRLRSLSWSMQKSGLAPGAATAIAERELYLWEGLWLSQKNNFTCEDVLGHCRKVTLLVKTPAIVAVKQLYLWGCLSKLVFLQLSVSKVHFLVRFLIMVSVNLLYCMLRMKIRLRAALHAYARPSVDPQVFRPSCPSGSLSPQTLRPATSGYPNPRLRGVASRALLRYISASNLPAR